MKEACNYEAVEIFENRRSLCQQHEHLVSYGCIEDNLYENFYRATVCNATHGIAVAILSVRLSSVCPPACQTRVL